MLREGVKRSRCDDHLTNLWERQQGKVRYVVLSADGHPLGADGEIAAPRRVSITLPETPASIDVLFEGRTITPSTDHFIDILDDAFAVHVYKVKFQ